MNITYEKREDYLIPNLIPDMVPEGELRKFGLTRKSYLENHRCGIYAVLLSGELKKHLLVIQKQAEERNYKHIIKIGMGQRVSVPFVSFM